MVLNSFDILVVPIKPIVSMDYIYIVFSHLYSWSMLIYLLFIAQYFLFYVDLALRLYSFCYFFVFSCDLFCISVFHEILSTSQ